MLAKEKAALTYIGKDDFFKTVFEKLTTDSDLEYSEKSYILACAILFFKHYQKDHRYISYADIAYYIVLKYSLKYKDYLPLYDFSINFGFYPIAKALLDEELVNSNLINNCLHDLQLIRFKKDDDYIETLEQYFKSKKFLSDESNEKSYLAPTSFGKSSLIVKYIKLLNDEDSRIVIVVPTKSLLIQTYQMIRDANLRRKIIIHDEMYDNEVSFVAIFTQERALRLLRRRDVNFDILFIDEAHNILKNNSRSILLSRLIAKNRTLNPSHKVIYLSPLIENVNNLKIIPEQNISSHVIEFNIKEPEIFEHRLNNEVYQYNRFVNQFYKLNEEVDKFDYLKRYSKNKNFLYNYRPVRVEQLANDLCENLPQIEMTENIHEIEQILTREVHKDYYAIEYLKYGVIYLHGKLPDIIKEYLEYKYKSLPELKYVIANSVILEGMNLPIDTLFIFNTRSLYGKELMNLIGRVNRLNNIFSPTSNELDKLLPRVHFVNNEVHNRVDSKMENKIKLLRSRSFEDKIGNPILDSFDIDNLGIPNHKKEEYRRKTQTIQDNESFIYADPTTKADSIKAYLIESGINEFYTDLEKLIDQFTTKTSSIKSIQSTDWKSMSMMEKIEHLFIHDLIYAISDLEIKRLSHEETRNYYENHILVAQKKALNENINSQFSYFKEKAQSDNSKLYFGLAYGEEPYVSASYPQPLNNVYVDLLTKSDAELINLAIVKLKMEDDFISFKLNKFIVMMFDYKLITTDEYNLYIYGTTDQKKIGLTKFGLSVSLISRLENDGQLNNLSFDEFNNLKGNPDFNIFVNSIDDFYKFEIRRYIN